MYSTKMSLLGSVCTVLKQLPYSLLQCPVRSRHVFYRTPLCLLLLHTTGERRHPSGHWTNSVPNFNLEFQSRKSPPHLFQPMHLVRFSISKDFNLEGAHHTSYI